ncbi:hypothetical protein OG474_30580 [Kribbella sp. NBC_01505]|uniref:hypothetical protein n=1 Tax=Kribbella sp. NBC_01505 TaxID=2903580 RepID=UPI00386FC7A2
MSGGLLGVVAQAGACYQEYKEWARSCEDDPPEDLDEHLYSVVEKIGAALDGLSKNRGIAGLLEMYDSLSPRRDALDALTQDCGTDVNQYPEADSEAAEINEELADIADAMVKLLRGHCYELSEDPK